MKRLTRYLTAAAAPAALAAILLGTAGQASAATSAQLTSSVTKVKTITGTTYSPEHYDTTSVATGLNSPNGPIWAYDYLHETFAATPGAVAGTWNVTINVHGSFDGFASPTKDSTPEVNQGTVIGTISYIVTSANTPKAGNLPRTEPNYTGLGAALSQFFGGSETVTGGGAYNFTYYNVDGAPYVQTG